MISTKQVAAGFLGFMAFIVLVSAIFAITAFSQLYRFWLQSPSEDVETIVFEVESGTSLGDIASALEDDGIIASAFWFKVYTVIGGDSKSIQAGLFELTPGSSYASVVISLHDATHDDLLFTIPEGFTLAQIGERLMAIFPVSESEWDQLVGMNSVYESNDLIVQSQKPDNVDLEGYLFPDTYRFYTDASGEDVVEKLLGTMEDRLLEEVSANNIPSQLETNHDVLTLASIIQREVMVPSEMAMVADIFLKRLEIGMPLQADSTVNYITGADTPAISLTDRDIDSLYNTYQYAGLPPGPISSPGMDAIMAVLNPTSNQYYYFLTTDEGEVIYATTHDQHVQNKNIYLR
ncbi:endolytic transglycosylase MltG [Candidatus Uhrbacteria bacterium]|jgi:UPF0755 protein|nr:endolytic transglycosylase MltG [Candidatus Uhrbacteria bacterium]